MRSNVLLGKSGLPFLAALALGAACASSTSSGPSAPSGESPSGTYAGGGADGGSADGGGMTGAAHDVGQAAGAASASAAQTAESAGRAVADAGEQAAGAARDTASSAATTAGDAARSAESGAREAIRDAGMGGDDAGTSQAAGELTDAQIAKVAVTANDVDIAGGKAAARQTKNAKVKEFAHEMVKDHTAANKQAAALAAKLGITPEDSDASRDLEQKGQAALRKLKGLKGAAFDRAYIANEVSYHEEVLRSLDETLIPGAKDRELKALLTKVRGVVNDHLEHARSLQSSMGGQ